MSALYCQRSGRLSAPTERAGIKFQWARHDLMESSGPSEIVADLAQVQVSCQTSRLMDSQNLKVPNRPEITRWWRTEFKARQLWARPCCWSLLVSQEEDQVVLVAYLLVLKEEQQSVRLVCGWWPAPPRPKSAQKQRVVTGIFAKAICA